MGNEIVALEKQEQQGRSAGALAWILGVPLPVLIILYLIFGR